jgi:hypothetical protein
MRALTMATGMLLGLGLGGCGGDGGREANRAEPANAAEPAAAEDVANRLAALPEGQRNAVFIRAIRDAGEECQHVAASVPAGEYQGNPVWSAQCEGGDAWTIVVTPDGSAQLVNESEARLVGVNAAAPQNAQGE